MRVRFGDFVLDRGTHQLVRADEARHLGPKAFELLAVLLSHRPNVVARERLRERLWPGTFVSDSTLGSVVAEVRSALDDDPRSPRFVRTVHGVGYAFCGQARESGTWRATPGPRAYRLILAGREIALSPGENLLGRIQEGVAWIDDKSVSRRHARILVGEGPPILEDLGSKNGTFLRGKRISAPAPLADGDTIRLGAVSMTLRALRSGEPTRTDVPDAPPPRSGSIRRRT